VESSPLFQDLLEKEKKLNEYFIKS
jgi:hypothetical protein